MTNNLNEWIVFETDTGDVYRQITRDEADELCKNGLGGICMVSKPNAPVIRRYQPKAEYKDEIYWKLILSSWSRVSTDWKADYLRKEKIRAEEVGAEPKTE